jgi:hypothetical protein
LREYIAPIIAWVVAALFTAILAVIAIGLLVALLWALGDLFIAQFSSSKLCGRSTYEAFDACFGTGAAISLVLLVCASNATYHDILKFSWSETSFFLPQSDPVNFAYGLMPSGAFNNLVNLFQWSSIPVFDTTNLLLFLFLMNSSLLMGLMSGIVIEPLRGLVNVDRAPAILKLFVYAVILPFSIIAVDSTASSE